MYFFLFPQVVQKQQLGKVGNCYNRTMSDQATADDSGDVFLTHHVDDGDIYIYS